jgi:hypothetical protein
LQQKDQFVKSLSADGATAVDDIVDELDFAGTTRYKPMEKTIVLPTWQNQPGEQCSPTKDSSPTVSSKIAVPNRLRDNEWGVIRAFSELRPKNWTQKQRFLVNSRARGLLGEPLVLELDRG